MSSVLDRVLRLDPPEPFTHTHHLQIALGAVERYGQDPGELVVRGCLQALAHSAGDPEKFNTTLTIFWYRQVCHLAEVSGTVNGDELMARNPILTHRDAPALHWSESRLNSVAAKKRWLTPDLVPLPWELDHTHS